MNAIDLADLIGAQPKRRGVWAAKCPICDYLSLQISGGRYDVPDFECKRGCSIYKILQAWEISEDEYASRPKLSRPNFGDMDDAEFQAYHFAHREREAKHKAACEKIDSLRRKLAMLKEKIDAESDDSGLSELEVKFERMRLRLKLAIQQERKLRV